MFVFVYVINGFLLSTEITVEAAPFVFVLSVTQMYFVQNIQHGKSPTNGTTETNYQSKKSLANETNGSSFWL